MGPKIEHYKDHYRVIWPDGSTTEVDTYEEAKQEINDLDDEYMACMKESLDFTGQWW